VWLPDVQVGSILEYHYTLNFKEGYVYDSEWILSNELFTKKGKFSLKVNPDFALRWNWPQGLPTGTDPPKDDHGTVRMDANNIPAFLIEDYMPPENELKFRVDFIYTDAYNTETDPVKFWKAFAKKRKASWLVNDSVPHSFTYTPDAAQSLVQLAERATAWNQTWHVPAAPNPLTGKEFVALAAKEFGVAPKYRVLSRPILRIAGWFDPLVAESYEMLYQSDSPYIFDSGKFAKEFGVQVTASSPEAAERTVYPAFSRL
jgi:hypothetical protein